MPTWLIIVIVITVLIVLWFLATYNKLVVLRNRVRDQWAQIDVQLKRRANLTKKIWFNSKFSRNSKRLCETWKSNFRRCSKSTQYICFSTINRRRNEGKWRTYPSII